MDNLVSIVVTCYNHEEYIEDCIRSLFQQTYKNIELIILNDGSTDKSEEIIQSLLRESPFSQTNYYYHENQGVVKTRNKGIELVNGEYVLFVDSDNYLPNNFILAMLEKAKLENADLVYTQLIDSETNEVLISQPYFDLSTMYKGNFMDNCSLIRKSIIGDVRYDSHLKKLVDYDFFMNLIVNNGAKAVSCMETHIFYRVLDNSISDHKNISKYYDAYGYLLSKYMMQHPDYAKEAIQFNFKRAIALSDPKIIYQNQFISIYYSETDVFSEEKCMKFNFDYQGKLLLTFPDEIRFLRIDMTESPIFLQNLSLLRQSNNTELDPISTNGIRLLNEWIFPMDDPVMVFSLGEHAGQNFELNYQLMNMTHVLEDGYIGIELTNQLQTSNKIQNEYHEKLIQSEQNYSNLQAMYKQLNLEYNTVIGSRRWIIPTKIINFFRRNK